MIRYVKHFRIWLIIIRAIYSVYAPVGVFSTTSLASGATIQQWSHWNWKDGTGFDLQAHQNITCKSLTKDIKCYENVTFVVTHRTDRISESYEHVLEIKFVAFKKQFTLLLHTENSRMERSVFHRHMTVTVIGRMGSRRFGYSTDRYFRGHLRNDPSSIFHGKYHDSVLDGIIYTAEESYYLKPMQTYFKTTNLRTRRMLVVYREKDVTWSGVNVTATADGLKISERNSGGRKDIYARTHFDVPSTGHRRRRQPIASTYTVCELAVVADYTFYRHACGGSIARTIERISFAVRAADIHFRRTDFNSDNVGDNIGFVIKRIEINMNRSNHDYSKIYNSRVVLQKFAQTHNFGDVCLGVLFTNYVFHSGVIGLAYTASSSRYGSPGGLCYPPTQYAHGWESLNSLLLTARNFLVNIPWTTFALTLTHEIGHSFGSSHDKTPACQPGGEYGMYLMHSTATDCSRANSFTFSPCSIRQMGPVVQYKGICLKVYDANNDNSCGNYVREGGEACDCGNNFEKCKIFDWCCVPPSANEPGCRIGHEFGHVCSPLASPCCTDVCQIATAARECRPATECTRPAMCDAVSVECPEPVPLADGTPCAGGVRVCSGGLCVGSRCELYGWVDCQCAGVEDELCQLCCMTSSNASHSDCKPAYQINSADNLKMPIYKNEMDPCNNDTGICTKTHACMIAYPKDFDNVFSAIFQKSAREEIVDYMANYWYYGLLAVYLVFLVVALFVYIYETDHSTSRMGYTSAKLAAFWLVINSQKIAIAEQLRRVELMFQEMLRDLDKDKPVDFLVAIARLSILFPTAPKRQIFIAVFHSNNEEYAVRRLLVLGFPLKRV